MPTLQRLEIHLLQIAVVRMDAAGAKGFAPAMGPDEPDPDWQPL